VCLGLWWCSCRGVMVAVCVCACVYGAQTQKAGGRIPPGNRSKGSTGIPRSLRSKDSKFQKNVNKRGNVQTSSKVRYRNAGLSWAELG
jgi:hypothetical protein